MLTYNALIRAIKAGSKRHYSFSREHDDTSSERATRPASDTMTGASNAEQEVTKGRKASNLKVSRE